MKNYMNYVFALLFMFASFAVQAEVVNINKADAAAMQYYLTGIGEKKSKDIVKYRKNNGQFKEIEDIMKVAGIGEGIFKKIKSSISISKGVTKAPENKKTNTKSSDSPSKAKDKPSKTNADKKPAA